MDLVKIRIVIFGLLKIVTPGGHNLYKARRKFIKFRGI